MMMSQAALTPLSWLYHTAVKWRHVLYDGKFFKKKYAPLPVVSIGNLVAGGAGKTQVALLLAEQLAHTTPVAILSRGFRSQAENGAHPLIVDALNQRAHVCGDEPLLLASRLPSALVIVNKNRFKSSLVAQKQGARLIILDDGMQHRPLHRDFEIVVLDGQTPFGPYLPKGRMREDPRRLKAADLILYVGDPDGALVEKVSRFTSAPQVISKIAVRGTFCLDGTPSELREKRVAVFCGIGNPHRFVKTVEGLGAQVIATSFARDHTIPGEEKLRLFAQRCQKEGAECLVCTEKDKVKLSHTNLALPIVWVKAGLEIVGNTGAWEKIVNEMKLLAGKPE